MFQTSVGDLGVRGIEFFEVFEGFQARQSGVGDFDGYETEGFEAFQARQVFEACVRDRGASEGRRFELAETLEVFQIGVGELVGQNPQISSWCSGLRSSHSAPVLTARQVDGDHVLKEILPEPASRPRRRVEFGVEFFGTDVVIAPDLTKGSEAAFVNKNIGLMALVIVDDSPTAQSARRSPAAARPAASGPPAKRRDSHDNGQHEEETEVELEPPSKKHRGGRTRRP